MDARVDDTLQTVTAKLNYLVKDGQRPYSYTYPAPDGKPQRSGTVDEVAVVIRDARPIAAGLSLAEEGFELRPFTTRVTDFYDKDQLEQIYDAEIEALLRAATGAEKVVIFDHTIRSVPKLGDGYREPVRRVHNDYTAKSGPRRVRDHLPPDEAEQRLQGRYYEVNVWRPIVGPLQDAPLAVCDARSIAPADLIASDLIYPDRVGETYAVAFNPEHRWYYFPKLRTDEAILLKCFESDETKVRGRYTAHTAFDDPTTPPDAAPRESIETRALVFFPS